MSWWERQWYKMLGGNVTVAGALRGATVTADNLTAGRVVVAGTAGLLQDDADLTFATDTLTSTKILVTGQGTFGDATTNRTLFDSTGHQTMTGTAKPWEDLRIEPVARTTGANAPTFEQWFTDGAGSRGIYLYSFTDELSANQKEVFFSMQMSHAWDGGSIYIHVHWIGNSDDTTAAPQWLLEYSWKEVGAVYGNTSVALTDGNNYTFAGVDANVTANTHYISKFAAIAPGASADSISSILIGRLARRSGNAADTYDVAGNKCGLLYIDAHYRINSLGSNDEYTE